MFTSSELETIKGFISNTSLDTKIYIGTDSTKLKKKNVRFATVVVIHQNGSRGCKIFGYTSFEKDIDFKANRPFNRMMNETYKTAEVYLELADTIGERFHEIHLDINTEEKHGSSVALSAAVGYIKGVCGINPITKPSEGSFAASCVADKLCKEG